MSYVVKTVAVAANLGGTLSCKIRSLYGRGAAAPGEDVFVWFSGTQDGERN